MCFYLPLEKRWDVDLPMDWTARRFDLLDEIETLMVESEDFCDSSIGGDDAAIGATVGV
ncbi:hypothetical protein Enr13x_65150 [Stieleria neptunia]|uniref:Uncharacterized protein n=1 Tax=Stieleria neptunia TaxID=2527979 RepID=A0A518I0H3_9BACT|nr:hypothetical protein [Stieleria neptunia]QDV46606.1 hypothetical protein Enr13x_65150 [Stieleria neptunia]